MRAIVRVYVERGLIAPNQEVHCYGRPPYKTLQFQLYFKNYNQKDWASMTCKYFTYAHIIDHVKQIVRPGMWIAVNGCLEQYKNTRYIRALDIFESLSTGTKHMDVTELAQQVGNTMVTPDQVDYEIDQEPEI